MCAMIIHQKAQKLSCKIPVIAIEECILNFSLTRKCH
ncbi:hypothetical protein BVRB_6g148290 [Beta vulgaris subsp. vulgaris]|nr:hypothetical protein BVRB_6g148290 [Beta vulgaris subsp. vulgaris]